MAKRVKKDTNFSKQRNILNFRPKIYFIEPDQIDEDTETFLGKKDPPDPNAIQTIDENKEEVSSLIEEFKEIEELCDLAQERINTRAKDMIINLDPQQDAHIIDSLRRHFNDPTKNSITYDDYIHCLNQTYEQSESNFFEIDPKEIELGASDPFRNTFGSMGLESARPELDPKLQPIKPIDMASFQEDGIIKLFEMLKPLLTPFVVKKIKELI